MQSNGPVNISGANQIDVKGILVWQDGKSKLNLSPGFLLDSCCLSHRAIERQYWHGRRFRTVCMQGRECVGWYERHLNHSTAHTINNGPQMYIVHIGRWYVFKCISVWIGWNENGSSVLDD